MTLYCLILILIYSLVILCEQLKWIHRPGTNFSYYTHEKGAKGKKVNFFEARAFCQKQEPGADLAIVFDEDEVEYIYNHTIAKNLKLSESASVFHYIMLDESFVPIKITLKRNPENNCTILMGRTTNSEGKQPLLATESCNTYAHSFVCRKRTDSNMLESTTALTVPVQTNGMIEKIIVITMILLIVLIALCIFNRICTLAQKMRLFAGNNAIASNKGDIPIQCSSEMIAISDLAIETSDGFFPIREPRPDTPEIMYQEPCPTTCADY